MFHGWVDESAPGESKAPARLYDIRIRQCLWEGEASLCITMLNISERIANERLVEINNYKDQLLATVSHDLRTPLHGIVAMLTQVKDNINEDSELLSFIEKGISFSQMLGHLINDILDYSQVKQGVLRINPGRFELRRSVGEVLSIFENHKSLKDISLVLKTAENLPTYAYSDNERLQQILMNLIGNALKFTRKGNITLSVERAGTQKKLIRFTVIDTGTGIKAENLNHLFHAFATLDEHRGINSRGIGLGLMISQRLAERLGPGSISVQSEPGKGSRFSFEIYETLLAEEAEDDPCEIQSSVISERISGSRRIPSMQVRHGLLLSLESSKLYGKNQSPRLVD